MELEDEADGVGAVAGRVVEPGHVLAADPDLAGVGPVERADQVEERALAAARRPGERDELARVELERDVLECADAAALEALPHMPDVDLGATHFTTAIDQRAFAGA